MTARRINDEMPEKIASQIRKKVKDLVKPQIVALGAAYKPDTYDIRESPAIKIVNLLREDGYQVELYDPLVKEYAYDSLLDVVEGKDCLVILVEHKKIVQELESNLELIKSRMRNPLIVRFYI
jgi:UDP-N-acetyl-D-mannosaminuronic acid dehydrogenase